MAVSARKDDGQTMEQGSSQGQLADNSNRGAVQVNIRPEKPTNDDELLSLGQYLQQENQNAE